MFSNQTKQIDMLDALRGSMPGPDIDSKDFQMKTNVFEPKLRK